MKNFIKIGVVGLAVLCSVALFALGIPMLNLGLGDSTTVHASGDGNSPATAFILNTESDLNTVLRTHAGRAGGAHFRLGADITMTQPWSSIPTLSTGSSLDGDGFTISDLSFISGARGLFTTINAARVENLNFDNVRLTATSSSGILAATIAGTTATRAEINNVNFNDVIISGTSSTTGTVAGTMSHAIVSNSTFTDIQLPGTGSSTMRGGVVGNATQNTTFSGLEINNVIVNGGGQLGGVVGAMGTIGGTVSTHRIEDVVVTGGTIAGSSFSTAGIVGSFDNGTLTMENVKNAANVSGSSWGQAGMVGSSGAHSGATQNITIRYAENTGTMTGNAQTSNGGVGGMAGLMWSTTNLTLEWVINTGRIERTTAGAGNAAAGGLVGNLETGSLNISDSLNSSEVAFINNAAGTTTLVGITGRRNAANSIVNLNNTHFNSSLFGGMMANHMTTAGFTNVSGSSGSFTGTEMEDPNFITDTFGAGSPFSMFEGRPVLTSFIPGYVYTFVNYDGEVLYTTHIPRLEDDFALPTAEEIGVPYRAGHVFDGWFVSDVGQAPIVGPTPDALPGDNVNNIGNRIIKVAHRLANIQLTISSESDIAGQVNGGSVVTITSTGVTLHAPTGWSNENHRWLASTIHGGSSLVGESNNTSLDAWLADISNFTLHAVPASASSTFDYEIVFRIDNRLGMASIQINGNPDGGSFQLVTSVPQTISAILPTNVNVSAPGGSYLTQLVATPNRHFRFVSFTITGTFGTETFTLQDDVTTDGTDYVLTFDGTEAWAQLANLTAGTITVNFAPVPYEFVVLTRIVGPTTSADAEDTAKGMIADSGTVVIGGSGSITAVAQEHAGVRFARWIVLEYGVDAVQTESSDSFTFNIPLATGTVLNRYTNNGAGPITIIAVYYQTFTMNIDVPEAQEGFGDITVTVWDSLTRISAPPAASLNNVEVPFNSIINISVARLGTMHEFVAFQNFPGNTNLAGNEVLTTTTARIVATDDRTISAVFRHRTFEVIFLTVVGGDDGRTDVANYTLRVGETPTSRVTFDDHFRVSLNSEMASHEFVGFALRPRTGTDTTITANTDIHVDMGFLNRYRDDHNRITVVARFIRLVSVTINVADPLDAMGHFTIGEETATHTSHVIMVPAGGTATINAIPAANHVLTANSFLGVHAAELAPIDGGQQIQLTNVLAPRNITVRFAPRSFTLTGTQAEGIFVTGNENIAIGDTVTLTVNVPNGRRIRTWTINGYEYGRLEVDRTGNVITFEFDNAWYTTHGQLLNSDVTFAMSFGLLMAILLPSILIPALLVLAILYVMSSKKKYATIHAELTAANQQKQRFQGDLIRELKEGKSVGQVTKEDVKRAQKEKKDKND